MDVKLEIRYTLGKIYSFAVHFTSDRFFFFVKQSPKEENPERKEKKKKRLDCFYSPLFITGEVN